MENTSSATPTSWLTIVTIIVIVGVVVIFLLYPSDDESIPEVQPIVEETIEVQPIIEAPIEEPSVVLISEPEEETVEEKIPEEPLKPILPLLEESDSWIKEKLPTLTWRKELLKLVIDDDIIRRLVVFTDNFTQGIIAYEHSLLVKPKTAFFARELEQDGQPMLKWNETSSRRFSLYVDLLRSLDSDTLISWYFELKPLIDQAYGELGYPDSDFTDVLQDAITKVLDMDIPKSSLDLVRPSVMFQFKDQNIEQQDDVEKFMLRLGKENLLVIKSVLLEINEKLSRGEP
jgi:hypothetical protein